MITFSTFRNMPGFLVLSLSSFKKGRTLAIMKNNSPQNDGVKNSFSLSTPFATNDVAIPQLLSTRLNQLFSSVPNELATRTYSSTLFGQNVVSHHRRAFRISGSRFRSYSSRIKRVSSTVGFFAIVFLLNPSG